MISKFINDHQNPFLNTKLIYIFLRYRSEFLSNTKQICIFHRCKSKFFSNTKLICIFLRCRSELFQTQNWSVFSLDIDLYFSGHKTNLNFFLKSFFFNKIANFEISKKKLRVRLESFLLICDARIVSLSHECESSFKSLFWFIFQNKPDFYQSNLSFYPLQKQIWFLQIKSLFFFFLTYKNRSDFYQSNLSFYPLQKQIWFLSNKSFFLPVTKTYLIFTNQIFFFFLNFQDRFDFSLKRGHVHKTNLFKLILSSVCHVYYNISFNINTKGYIMVIRV